MIKTDAKTQLKRFMTVFSLIVITIIIIYCFNACSIVYSGTIDINQMIGCVYVSGSDLDYILRIDSNTEVYYSHSNQEEKLFLEAKDNILRATNDMCDYIFVGIKGDQLFFQNNNIILVNFANLYEE